MDWVQRHGVSIAILISVFLSALIGVIGNALVGSWGWALMTTMVVLVSCLAFVEVFRHRATRNELAAMSRAGTDSQVSGEPAATADPVGPPTMSFTHSTVRRSVIAGGDVRQTKIGTGGLVGLVAVALALGGGTTVLGRTTAAVPERAVNQTPSPLSAESPTPVPTPTTAAAVASNSPNGDDYSSESTVVTDSGKDLDPDDDTNGLADVSFHSSGGEGGLSLLNGAAVAVLPDGSAPAPDVCRAMSNYSTALIAMPIDVATVRCLRTSDGRYGSLAITHVREDALGGLANITWTLW